jgi:tetratricopeptide (TPR) repeat protein
LDPSVLLAQARERRDSGDLGGALELYERVMHRRPNHLEEIIADLEAIVEGGSSQVSTHRLLGEAYAMAGQYKQALEQYRLAMAK